MKIDNIKMELDELDVKILNLLHQDARMPYSKIAGELGVTTPTARNRVKNLLKLGVVKRYSIVLDDQKIGGATSIILVDVEPGSLDKAANVLTGFEEVREVYYTSGDMELVLKVFVESMDSLGDFLTKELGNVQGIRKIKNYLVIKSAKEEDKVVVKARKRIILKCEFCVCEIPHEPFIKKIEEKEHYFCCEHCARAYEAR